MQQIVTDAYEHAGLWRGQGRVADYIPELAKADINNLGVSITNLAGRTYSIGNSDIPFTVQSISKVILLATALQDKGFDQVFSCVGMEPTGDPFNSIVRLESVTSKPLNPMINAGAIAVTTCIGGDSADERFSRVLTLARKLTGNDSLNYNHDMYRSESLTGDRNRALAYMMRSSGVFGGCVAEHLEVYFRACSIMANCEEISRLAAVLANDGVAPHSGEALIEPFFVKLIRSLMCTCGMYDASGEFALRVGIPSKSGVGGGIIAAAPHKMGIAVYSPGLDKKGNSLCGIKALEYLSSVLNLSVF